MDFTLNSKDYMDYIAAVNQELNEQEEYITNLDLATGDGDHWANLHMGFTKLTEEKSRLEALDISSELKEIGKIMMAVIGGSSGVDVESLCKRVAEAAERGAEDTKNMESIKGRATYQSNKGVGHLDPGAVTMALQIKTLMNKALEKRGA